jgi:hypothetical protein
MDAKALKLFVERHPAGVIIRMIDGTAYEIPHRDYIWFTPTFGEGEGKAPRIGTSFWIADPRTEEYRLVNAMLVKEAVPLNSTGKGKGRKRSA